MAWVSPHRSECLFTHILFHLRLLMFGQLQAPKGVQILFYSSMSYITHSRRHSKSRRVTKLTRILLLRSVIVTLQHELP
jgi:hypothetical protein